MRCETGRVLDDPEPAALGHAVLDLEPVPARSQVARLAEGEVAVAQDHVPGPGWPLGDQEPAVVEPDQRALRRDRLALGEEHQQQLVAQVQDLEPAGGDVELEAAPLVRLEVGELPRQQGDDLRRRQAVRRLEALGEVVAQVIVLDRQRLGMPEDDVADLPRDRERDLNVVVERHVVERVAERALEPRMDLVELAEAAGDLWAVGAQQQPVHLEQADLRGMYEQLDRLGLGKARRPGVLDRVDPEQIVVVRRAHKGFQRRQHPRLPAPRHRERREAILQDLLDEWRGRAHLVRDPLVIGRSLQRLCPALGRSASTACAGRPRTRRRRSSGR